MRQRYVLKIWDMFSIQGAVMCGAQAVIAIMDGEAEIDRFTLKGKCQGAESFSRSYTGKPGLYSRVVSGPGRSAFDSIA